MAIAALGAAGIHYGFAAMGPDIVVVINPFGHIAAHIKEAFGVGFKAANICGYRKVVAVIGNGEVKKPGGTLVGIIVLNLQRRIQVAVPGENHGIACAVDFGCPGPLCLCGQAIAMGVPVEAAYYTVGHLIERRQPFLTA